MYEVRVPMKRIKINGEEVMISEFALRFLT